jgi:hypothetical protein
MTPKKRKTRLSTVSRLIRDQYLEAEDEDNTVLRPMQKALNDVETELGSAHDEARIVELSQMKVALATRIKLELVYRCLLLILLSQSGRMDAIERWIRKNTKGAIDKREQAAEVKFDMKVAKRLAQLFEMKGHEGLYDTGTKPSRSN